MLEFIFAFRGIKACRIIHVFVGLQNVLSGRQQVVAAGFLSPADERQAQPRARGARQMGVRVGEGGGAHSHVLYLSSTNEEREDIMDGILGGTVKRPRQGRNLASA